MTDFDVSEAPERDHADVLVNHLTLNRKSVLDVGCGAGRITRIMAQLGADVIGIDPGDHQLARARAADQVSGETYIQGTAERLPSQTSTIDIVVFSNSLHHVPVDRLDRALAEARRVLKSAAVSISLNPWLRVLNWNSVSHLMMRPRFAQKPMTL